MVAARVKFSAPSKTLSEVVGTLTKKEPTPAGSETLPDVIVRLFFVAPTK